MIEFFIAMNPPTITYQEHKVAVVHGKPVFYDPPELKAARQKLMAHLGTEVPEEPYRRGNCKGRNILSFDFECEDAFLDNDCQLTYHDDLDFFTCVLKNKKGDILEFEGDAEEMNNLIVGIEIIDFVEDKP